jgi:hypothetical protein
MSAVTGCKVSKFAALRESFLAFAPTSATLPRPGTNSITAVYEGDSNNSPSTSAPLNQIVLAREQPDFTPCLTVDGFCEEAKVVVQVALSTSNARRRICVGRFSRWNPHRYSQAVRSRNLRFFFEGPAAAAG